MVSFFFYPKTIAVIGATNNPKKFGNAVTINILQNKNLQCDLFLVTPTSEEILGLKCYKSILEVPVDINVAIISVPAKVVDEVIDQCINKKVKGIIVITAGFGEIDDEGKRKEREIGKKCKNAGVRLLGPNCVGIQNLDIGLNASFIQAAPPGKIGMISQSGSFGCATFYAMERNNIGCSKFANIGNGIDVSFNEILEFFNSDQKTQIICIYMETINNGRNFIRILKNIIPDKPIVLLKGGRTSLGMKAARSHTGSIASNYKMLKTSIEQVGAVICENVNDFVTALKTFSFLPAPRGERIGILTNSGGSSVLFSDMAEEFHLTLAEFNSNLRENLTSYLLPMVKLANPLDMIGVADENVYFNITKLMLEDPGIDIVVACVVIPPFLEMKSDEHYRGIINAWNATGREKPLIPLMMFSEDFKSLREYSKREKTTIFFTPHDAAYAVKILIDRMKNLKKTTN
ncbi:MAG: acetate--CoA ligase family protein [Promethearchaeota archaeon]|jgi:acyl-CoA synthetase (NDP forming)